MRGAVEPVLKGEAPLVVLRGDWKEMGAKSARLTEDAGLLDYFLHSPRRFAAHAFKERGRLLEELGYRALKAICLFPASLGVRGEDRGFLKGMAKGASLSYRQLLESFAAPDIFAALVHLACRFRGRAIPQVMPLCSSFVVTPEASGDGTLYHGRNLDFAGGLHWSHAQRMVLVEPERGIPFLMLTGEGLYIPGVTAINREGLTISVNMLFVGRTRLFRTPLLTILSQVISQADSIEAAESILRRRLPFAGWGITLSDSKTGEGVLFETSPAGLFRVEPEDGILCSTNTCLSPRTQEWEYAPSSTWVEHNHTRYRRLKELLLQEKGQIDAPACLSILSDPHDASSGQVQLLGNAIAMAGNVLSALFNPQNDTLWLSQGEVPANSLGVYTAYSLSGLFRGEVEVKGRMAPHPESKERRIGFRHFMNALHAWDEHLDLNSAVKEMELAEDFSPQEPLFSFMLALLLCKKGEFQKALEHLESLGQARLSCLRRTQVTLWKGRIMDLVGRRGDAVALYRQAISMSRYKDLTDAAWRGMRRGYSSRELQRLDFLFLVADWVE